MKQKSKFRRNHIVAYTGEPEDTSNVGNIVEKWYDDSLEEYRYKVHRGDFSYFIANESKLKKVY